MFFAATWGARIKRFYRINSDQLTLEMNTNKILHWVREKTELQTLTFTMKGNYTFKNEIRKVVRKMSAVALCALIVTASAQGGTPAFYKEAEAGQAWAQYEVGECYRNGNGVSKDYAEAAKWYRKAAEQRNAKAQFRLGVCYKWGDGVSKDYVEAVKWYRKAVEGGNIAAQGELGVCYEYGWGVSRT